MQKINKEDYNKLKFRIGWGVSAPFYAAIDNLDVDEALVINVAEWPLQNQPNPGSSTRFKASKKKFAVRTLQEDKGWAILRVL